VQGSIKAQFVATFAMFKIFHLNCAYCKNP
jgi:hypothetical protein